LNRAVPIIAIQLNACTLDDAVFLHFTTVLDVYQEAEDVDAGAGEQVDRRYWDRKAGQESLAVLDQVVAIVEQAIAPPRVTWNKNHVALGTSGYNFCWFHPRKSTPHCHLRIRTGAEERDALLRQLDDAGVAGTPFQDELITIKLSRKHLADSRDAILTVFRYCEERSRGGGGSTEPGV
jgi:hypothetical protein